MEKTSGASLELAPYHTQTTRGYTFELKDIKKSCVVLYYQYVLMFVREQSRWLVTVLNHKKETDKIIIIYWLPNVSDNFEVHSSILIQPLNSLDQPEMLPEIPIGAVEMEFDLHRDDDDSDMADNFFARLL